MSHKKITELTENTSPVGTDLMHIVDDPSGAPLNQRITMANLQTYFQDGVVSWPQSQQETDNGATVTDDNYYFGNVFRYGAIADSASGSQGTDNAAAFQRAVDSGHPVYVPEGWYAIESAVKIFSDGPAGGGKTFIMTSNTRLERYGASKDPILWVSGDQNFVDGNSGILAARSAGGYTKGLFLLGPDPTSTATTDAGTGDCTYNCVQNFKIIGKTSNTGWDGSVGFWGESVARKRGSFVSPQVLSTYYNTIKHVYVQQFDFNFYLSTDFNANSFHHCASLTFGHSAYANGGYGNMFIGCKAESPTAQDTTERFVWWYPKKNDPDGPTNAKDSDSDAATVAISAITKGTTTTIDCSAVHGLTTDDKVKLADIVDSGAGDLAALLNEGHFEVTVTDTDSFTINYDTSGAAATFSSGNVYTDFYPILTPKTNVVMSWTEAAFNASTQVVRLTGQTQPIVDYSNTNLNLDTLYGRNHNHIAGTHPGGLGIGGVSTDAGIGNNHIDVPSAWIERTRTVDIHGWRYEKLDDDSGNVFYKDSTAYLAGRKASMSDSFTYDLFSVDNVGTTSASVLIEVTYQGKESATQDHAGGKVIWLCPVTASTERAPIVVSRENADFGGTVPFYLTCTEASGGAANTGKFTVSVITQSVSGTGHFCSWEAKIVASNLLDGSTANLDWLGDLSYLSSSTSGLVADTEWKTKTKYKDADESVPNATMQEDDDLKGWDLVEDEVYRFYGHLRYFENGGDLKITFEFTNAPQEFSWEFQASQDNAVYYRSDSDHTVEKTVTALTANQESFISMSGFFKGNSTTAGSVALNWAQNTIDGSNPTIMREGSWITVERLGPGS